MSKRDHFYIVVREDGLDNNGLPLPMGHVHTTSRRKAQEAAMTLASTYQGRCYVVMESIAGYTWQPGTREVGYVEETE